MEHLPSCATHNTPDYPAGKCDCNILVIENIARICHAANRAYCSSILSENSPSWEESNKSLRDSLINGVQFVLEGPDTSESAIHNNWLKYKANDGWSYGKVKSEEEKTHPCMVPFDQLPVVQQIKGVLFKAIVEAMS